MRRKNKSIITPAQPHNVFISGNFTNINISQKNKNLKTNTTFIKLKALYKLNDQTYAF